jgi:hypothetical protein
MTRTVPAFVLDWLVASVLGFIATLGVLAIGIAVASGTARFALAAAVGIQICLIAWLVSGRHRPPSLGRRLLSL